jgi:hypothetical protein
MAIFIKSLKNIYASNSKKPFILSLLAALAWLMAIGLSIISETVVFEHGNITISLLLAISVFFSINAIPRTIRSSAQSQIKATEKELPDH